MREEEPDIVEFLPQTNSAPRDFVRIDRPRGDGRGVGRASAPRRAAQADGQKAEAQAVESPFARLE